MSIETLKVKAAMHPTNRDPKYIPDQHPSQIFPLSQMALFYGVYTKHYHELHKYWNITGALGKVGS
jgi:hypothetical protein